MKDNNGSLSKQLVLPAIGIFIMVLVIIGVAFGMHFYNINKQRQKDISTATITMNYTHNSNDILISAKPISDNDGKLLTDEANVFDFTVNAKMKSGLKIKYIVVAAKDSSATIPDKNIKLYLQKSSSSDYVNTKEVLLPTLYSKLINDASNKDGVVLDSGTFTKPTTVYYRLKMWTDSNYGLIDNNKFYKVKVNVQAYAE